ncbi:hypothetical protein BLJAPNOD_02378 [Ensifer sp. M14]|uniref:hypothetical protein n=1 Tax=Ensifer sp. M14 TaxID=2203782 RepID=UPI000E1CCC99|nr:hypothetical protein [Ensifer sp. M14]RDL51246.1 hypothetical protein BLJAPNOD_02378 [Ensifer sp. M14]
MVEEEISNSPAPEAPPPFALVSVGKITENHDDALMVNLTVSFGGGEPEAIVDYAYRVSDPFGLAPVLKDWLAANPGFPVDPYVPPPAPTPEELRAQMPPLTARQFRLGLVSGGYSPAQVTQAIDTMPEGPNKETAKIEWQYATTFNRMHPLIATVGAALGLTEGQIDAMWTAAVNL